MRARLHDERGAVLVMVAALILPALLLVTVYVVDVSSWWTHKRHLQLQADAAVLAGAAYFNECFAGTNGTALSTADANMQAEANTYAGLPSSTYNKLSGTGSSPGGVGDNDVGSLAIAYNSKTYPDSAPNNPPSDDGTLTGTSCQYPYMFDVKESEANQPFLFSGIGAIIPGLQAVMDQQRAVRAHSRVQLLLAQSGKQNPPLVIPDVNPKFVFVTLVNLTTNTAIGTYDLCCYPGTSNGLAPPNNVNTWTGTAPLTMPAGDSEIGIRVGLQTGGSVRVGTCGPNDGAGGANWSCFDATNGTTPLAVIRGYRTSLSTSWPSAPPVLGQVTENTCAGSPFSSFLNGSSCATTLSATVNWPSCPTGTSGYTCTDKITASDSTTNWSQTVTASTGTNTYNFTPPSYAVGTGQHPVTLSWSYTTSGCGGNKQPACPFAGKNGNDTFQPRTPGFHQQAYSADPDVEVTGPIEKVSVSGGGGSFQESTPHSLAISVGLQGNLGSLPVPSTAPLFLRVSSGGARDKSNVVNCDGNGNSGVTKAFTSGCQTTYQINPTGVCPDTTSPADCVPLQSGVLGNTLLKALDDRFSGSNCQPVRYPGTLDPTDPRLIQLLITDLIAYLQAPPGGQVPVTNFGGFYITGYGMFQPNNQKLGACQYNQGPPSGAVLNSKTSNGFVAIWGYFVRYINQWDVGGSPCPGALTITPCVATLVR